MVICDIHGNYKLFKFYVDYGILRCSLIAYESKFKGRDIFPSADKQTPS